jgi:two-component system sensor histidine kinase YesM
LIHADVLRFRTAVYQGRKQANVFAGTNNRRKEMQGLSHLIKGSLGRFSNMKIHSQLLLVYSIAGLLPMLLLGALLVSNSVRLVSQQHYAQAAADNKRVKMIVFNVTYHAFTMSESIFYDDQLKRIVSARYSDTSQVYQAYRNYTLPDTYLKNYIEISGITIYVNNKTMITNGSFALVTDDISKSEWYQTAKSSTGGIFWYVNPVLEESDCLWLVRKIPLSNAGDFAVLVIGISINYLKLMINDSTFQTFASLDNGRVFFSDDYADIGKDLPIKALGEDPQMKNAGETKYGDNDVLYSSSVQRAVNTNNSFRVVTIDKAAPSNIRTVELNCILIVAVSLLVPYLLIVLFLNLFNRRILTLRSEMHKVAGGDYRVVDKFNGKDELSDVYADMKTMIDCISTEKLTREKLLTRQQRIEFEMLSSQINPHFLFNTLETIRMKALMNGDREGARISNLLSKSMRHVLEVGHAPVSLASELEYIRIYLEIQALRFGEKIESRITVSEDVDIGKYLILPLLLQPVVENSVVHGLEEKDGKGCVRISIYREGENLLIDISDDGIGINADDLSVLRENIRNSVAAQAKAGIGLTNVHQRIKLFYGPSYGLTVDSRINEGTKVILTLPGDGKGVIGNDSAIG